MGERNKGLSTRSSFRNGSILSTVSHIKPKNTEQALKDEVGYL